MQPGRLAPIPGGGDILEAMSTPYRYCRGCGAAAAELRISKRGWCPTCAIDRATQAAAASVRTAAALPPPKVKRRRVKRPSSTLS